MALNWTVEACTVKSPQNGTLLTSKVRFMYTTDESDSTFNVDAWNPQSAAQRVADLDITDADQLIFVQPSAALLADQQTVWRVNPHTGEVAPADD